MYFKKISLLMLVAITTMAPVQLGAAEETAKTGVTPAKKTSSGLGPKAAEYRASAALEEHLPRELATLTSEYSSPINIIDPGARIHEMVNDSKKLARFYTHNG